MAGLAPNKLDFSEVEEPNRLDFSEVQATPPSTRYDPISNSEVLTPGNFSDPSVSRESKEFIEGRSGDSLFGNTDMSGFIKGIINAPGGFAEPQDILKIGSLASPLVGGTAGLVEERIALGRERRPITLEEAFAREPDIPTVSPREDVQRFQEVLPLISQGLIDAVIGGRFKQGFQEILQGVAQFRQFAPQVPGTSLIPKMLDRMIQNNPEKAERLSAAMKKSQENTDDFLIRNNLMFGPDDEPTFLGNLISQLSLTGGVIGTGVMTRNPGLFASVVFGGIQKGTGFKEAEEAGKPAFEASTLGNIQGATEFGMSNIELGYIMRVVDDKAAGIAKKVAAGFIGETIEEGGVETIISGVTELAGVTDSTPEEIVQGILMAMFYGGLAGAGTTGSIAVVQKIVDRAIPTVVDGVIVDADPSIMNEGSIIDLANIIDEALIELNEQVDEQVVSDIEVENQIAEDASSDTPVTKAAQSRGESQAKLAAIFDKINKEEDIDVEKELDELDPQRRIDREQARLAESRVVQDAPVEDTVVSDRIAQLEADHQIADQESEETALSKPRRTALRKFVQERRDAIKDRISKIAGKKKAELAADHQNTVDALSKIQKDMGKAAQVKGEARAPQVVPGTVQVKIESAEELAKTPEQLAADRVTRQAQIRDANEKITARLAKEMDDGIPSEGLMLQVRYLDILQQGAKVSPQELALFEDDLNAFIATGEGVATDADNRRQAEIDRAKEQIDNNIPKTTLAKIEEKWGSFTSEAMYFLGITQQTLVDFLGLQGTVFDLAKKDTENRVAVQDAIKERDDLADEVADNGDSYKKDLKKDVAIDVPRDGMTSTRKGQSKNVKWTRGELINAWMLLQEPSVKEQLMNPEGRNGWTQEFVDLINKTMTPQDEDFALGLFDIYNRSYDRFNAKYRETHNRDLSKVEFYTTISREIAGDIESGAHSQTMFTDLIFGDEEARGGLKGSDPKESKERVPASTSEILVKDVNDSYDKYVYDVEHFISYAEELGMISKLMKDDDFRDNVREIAGDEGLSALEAHVKILNKEGRNTGWMYDKFEFFRRNFLSAQILGKVKIGLGQMASQLALAAGVPKKKWLKYSKSFATDFKKANDILNQHPTFARRELNFDSDIDQLGKLSRKTFFKRLSFPVRKGDLFAMKSGAWARYRWLTEDKGMSHEEALEEVANLSERSQQSTLPSQLTLAQKDINPLVRSLTMFHSSPTAMFNMSLQSVAKFRQSEHTQEDKKEMIDTLVIQNIVIPALFATLSGRPLTGTMLIGSASGIPVVSQVMSVLITVIANMTDDDDDPLYTEILEVPIEEVFKKTISPGVATTEFIETLIREDIDSAIDDVEWENIVKNIGDILEIWGGVPSDNIIDSIAGMSEAVGFTGDSNVEGGLKALGFEGKAVQLQLDRIDKILPGDQSDEEQKSTASGRISRRTGAF